jgi:hypothetical protein
MTPVNNRQAPGFPIAYPPLMFPGGPPRRVGEM